MFVLAIQKSSEVNEFNKITDYWEVTNGELSITSGYNGDNNFIYFFIRTSSNEEIEVFEDSDCIIALYDCIKGKETKINDRYWNVNHNKKTDIFTVKSKVTNEIVHFKRIKNDVYEVESKLGKITVSKLEKVLEDLKEYIEYFNVG